MTDKITLSDLTSLANETTAITTINNNSAIIVDAFNTSLFRDGTNPNEMIASLDMNSNRILNLPTPVSNLEPARLIDLETLTGSGTITVNPTPTGGTVGQVLAKNSSSNFDYTWQTEMPLGGTAGQVLAKNSSTNFDSSWTAQTVLTTIDGNSGTFTTGNGINSTGKVIELTPARRTLPTFQKFTSGTSATYTTPANCLWIRIRMVGGGGGGGGGGTSGNGGSGGGNSVFSGSGLSTLTAGGGTGAPNSNGTTSGGAATNGNVLSLNGSSGGGAGTTALGSVAGGGGVSYFGGAGAGGGGTSAGGSATPNSGSGGGGGGGTSSQTGSGGGAGAYIEHIITSPVSTYTYTVGAAGAGGANGSGGGFGGAGSAGFILVEEYYN